MNTALALLAAVLLDAWLGEPRRAHPLVAFGHLASWIESRLWRNHRAAGMLAWMLAVLPWVVLAWLCEHALRAVSPWLAAVLDAVLAYFAIGLRSLGEHARPVAAALEANDLAAARAAVDRTVGRDAKVLDAEQVAVAATESVLENGNDAVFGALFWCALLGAPGVVLYRLANTSAHLTKMLQTRGLPPAGGTALFQWCLHPRAAAIHAALARRGILVRRFDDPPSLRFDLPGDDEAFA